MLPPDLSRDGAMTAMDPTGDFAPVHIVQTANDVRTSDLTPLPPGSAAAHTGAYTAKDGSQVAPDETSAVMPPAQSLLGVTLQRAGEPYITITGVLGEGGFGTVYLGVEPNFYNRPVVVKVISKGGGADPVQSALRFDREMEVTADMRFPFAVQAYGTGQHEGQPYLVLERAEGTGLDAFIKTSWKDKMTTARHSDYVGKVITLMGNVIAAVQFAHNRGIVHRDLKPSNIVYRPANEDDTEPAQVKLLDWGIAKRAGVAEVAVAGSEGEAHSETITCAHTALGTVQYMAPEQFTDAASVDGRADVYALGVTLYELLAGVRPFAGAAPNTIFGVQKAKVAEQYPPLVEALRAKGLPVGTKLRELGSIVEKCLRPLPLNDEPTSSAARFGMRYESAGSLLADLERWEKGDLVHAHVEARGYNLGDAIKRSSRPLLALFSLAAMLVGGTFFAFFLNRVLKKPPQKGNVRENQ